MRIFLIQDNNAGLFIGPFLQVSCGPPGGRAGGCRGRPLLQRGGLQRCSWRRQSRSGATTQGTPSEAEKSCRGLSLGTECHVRGVHQAKHEAKRQPRVPGPSSMSRSTTRSLAALRTLPEARPRFMPRERLGHPQQPFHFLRVSLGSNMRWLTGRRSSINGGLMRPFHTLTD